MLRRIFSLIVATMGVSAILALSPGVPQAFAASTKVIAVVIDYGTGAHRATLSHCVRVPLTATDADAVADLIAVDGGGSLRWASSGLLCGVAGVPATGCGTTKANGQYQYWAYFHGSEKGWAYANNGPAEVVAAKGQAVGLRFETNGKGAASDLAPSVLAGEALQCSTGILDAKNLPEAPQSKSAWMAAVLAGGLLVILIPAAIVVLRIRSRED